MGEVSTMKSQDWSGQLAEGGRFPLAEADRFQSLWSAARVSLGSYLACFVPHRAMIEDCLQEVAVLAWQKAPKERGPDEFLAYCMGCAKRVAKVAIRKQRIGRLQFLEPDVAQSLADAITEQGPSMAESDQRLVALRHCLDQLDPAQREILDARYNRAESDSLKHEAERRRRTLDSIYKQLERIRTALRNCVTRNVVREP
jgi:RNA polymerase sigma factor (sigma-70 family)